MKNKRMLFFSYIVLIFLSCDESLPPRIIPMATVDITDVYASQGRDNYSYYIVFSIVGKNFYEETFQDVVQINGNIKIKWVRDENVRATVHLTNFNFIPPTRINGSILTVDPQEKIFLEAKWYLSTDDGQNIANMLFYPIDLISGDVAYSRPEVFTYRVELKLYDQLGLLHSQSGQVTLQAWKTIDSEHDVY